MRKLGWIPYGDLRASQRKLVDDNLPDDVESPKRGWYKLAEPRSDLDMGITLYRPEPLKENAS